jgi:hypothetical protein
MPTIPPEGWPVPHASSGAPGWDMRATLLPSVAPGASVVFGLAALPDLMVAVGATVYSRTSPSTGASGGGVVWISSDGRKWQRVDDEAFSGCMLQDAFAIGNEVLIGGACTYEPTIWSSIDGVTWHAHTLPNPGTNGTNGAGVTRIVGIKGQLLALGSYGRTAIIWRSSDGDSWTVATLPATSGDSQVSSAARLGSRWIALLTVGQTIRPISSSDGKTWTAGAVMPLPRLKPSNPPAAHAMLVLNGRVLGMGETGTGVDVNQGAVSWSSGDGKSWSLSVAPTIARDKYENSTMYCAIGLNGGVVAAGLGGVWVTKDGRTWTAAPANAGGYDGGYTWMGPWFMGLVVFHGTVYGVAEYGEVALGDIGAPANPSIWQIKTPLG